MSASAPRQTVRKVRTVLLEHQRRAMLAFSKWLVFVGGFGSGKTELVVRKALWLAWKNAPLPVAVYEPTYQMVGRILLPAFEAHLAKIGAPKLWHESKHRLRVWLHGRRLELWLLGAKNPDHQKGPNLPAALVDEAGQVDSKAIRAISSRVRGKGKCLQFVLSGTPETMAGEFYDAAERQTEKFRGLYDAGDLAIVRAQTYDNPFIDPDEYIRTQLAGLSEDEIDRYVRGLFVPPRGRVYSNFRPAEHVRPWDGGYGSLVQLALACDFNLDPMCWALCVMRRIGGKWHAHVIDEIIRSNTNTAEQAHEAAAIVAELRTGDLWAPDLHVAASEVNAYSDPAGAARSTKSPTSSSDHDLLRRQGFKVVAENAHPRVRDRVYTLNVGWLAEDRLLVAPHCTETIKSLSSQGYDKYGEPDKTRGLDHIPDALGYMCHRLDPRLAPRGNTTVRTR